MTLKSKKKIKDLTPYAGQWVAFIKDKLVAHEESLSKLMKKVKKKYPQKEPSVFLVPRKDEGPYIYNLLGRGNFFEPFDITFREKKKLIVIKI